MTTQEQARAQALWLKKQAGGLTEAEEREWERVKARMWRESRRS